MSSPSPLRGEGGARPRSGWEGEGVPEEGHKARILVLFIGSIELIFGILVTLLMAGIVQEQSHDEDAWSVLCIGLAFIVIPGTGILASSLSRGSALPRIVLVALVGMAVIYGGSILA